MQTPVQVAFKGVPESDAVQAAAWKHADELEKFFNRITSCRVVIEAPHRHHLKGKLFSVRVDITVPGSEIVVNREHRLDHAHEDVYVAMRDAFIAARRQLEDYVRVMRGQTKNRAESAVGRIGRLLPTDEGGFVVTPDGREVYFHRHALVAGDFDQLKAGDEVRFVEEAGDKGPQASTVELVHPRRRSRIPAEGET